MTDQDDIHNTAKQEITLGGDVSMLSISELEERITEMTAEIERLKRVIISKGESKKAAESVFKL